MVEIYCVRRVLGPSDEFIQDGDRVVVLGRLTGEGRSSGQRFEGSRLGG